MSKIIFKYEGKLGTEISEYDFYSEGYEIYEYISRLLSLLIKYQDKILQLEKELSGKEAWADMPQEAIDYLKTLPEFNTEIFEKVIGIKI